MTLCFLYGWLFVERTVCSINILWELIVKNSIDFAIDSFFYAGDGMLFSGKVSDQAMQNPQALAALQDKIDNVSHSASIMDR